MPRPHCRKRRGIRNRPTQDQMAREQAQTVEEAVHYSRIPFEVLRLDRTSDINSDTGESSAGDRTWHRDWQMIYSETLDVSVLVYLLL
ncbi:hypothetical protein NDU88_003860 [Pleurodeles waltl]|uniref:Uncharacterized protein n=1 Tax=Pleurodeles waltl TaxID=8319 RepID=A0AAV7UZQ7_PLEWA|nr:hypothetical protein NDU88_003860 [Pleurodeles waltl]